jgi:hypothetical protein
MIGHEIDDRLQPVSVEPLDQLLKFLKSVHGICRVIRTDIEVILDRIRTAREPFQEIGVIRRLAKFRVIGRGRLLKNSGEPDMGESHLANRGEGRVIDVREFADAIFCEGAVSLPGFVRVAEHPNEQLIDANSLLRSAGATAVNYFFAVILSDAKPSRRSTSRVQRFSTGSLDFARDDQLVVVRNVFVPDPAFDCAIRAPPKPAPAVIGRRILCVDSEVDAGGVAERGARNLDT